MKVTVEENKEVELDYPKIMISDLGQIIIALSETEDNLITGFMIKSNGYSFCGTTYSENISKPKFRDFHGTITIKQ